MKPKLDKITKSEFFRSLWNGGSPKGIKRRAKPQKMVKVFRSIWDGGPRDGRSPSPIYINRIRMFVCLCVCLFVCLCVCLNFNSSWGKRAIYVRFSLNVYKFTRECILLRNNFSDRPSGRYWPESGHGWKKTAKNGLFFYVFGNFDPLPDKIFIQNF